MLDWTTAVASVLASTVLSSIVTGIIAPRVDWGIEKKKLTRAYQETHIQKWRQMVHEVALRLDEIQSGESPPITGVRSPVAYLLDRHPDFPSLKPRLLPSVKAEIYGGMTIIAGATIDSRLIPLIDEIARIENEWGLSSSHSDKRVSFWSLLRRK